MSLARGSTTRNRTTSPVGDQIEAEEGLSRRQPLAAHAGDDGGAGRTAGARRFDHDVGLFVADESDNQFQSHGFDLRRNDASRPARGGTAAIGSSFMAQVSVGRRALRRRLIQVAAIE